MLAFFLACGTATAQILNVAVPGSGIGTLDPHRAVASTDVNLVNWLFNGLVRIKPGHINPQLIEPDLAEQWTSSADGLEWTFRLRDGVRCHGGYGPLTADDVVFSLKRAANIETSSFFADYSAFRSIEAFDRLTVRILLREPVPDLLGLLVPYHGGNIVCRKAVEALGDQFARSPVGTGPFQVLEQRPGEFIRLTANEGYFRGTPHIKEILFRYVPSDDTRDFAFLTSEAALIGGRPDSEWLDRVGRRPGATVRLLEPVELHMLHLNTSSKPLDDIRVRKAIAHAIDREELLRFRGPSVARAATSVVPSRYFGQVAVPLPEYDLVEAKRLLAEAGYPNGIKLQAIQSRLPTTLASMTVIQSQLRAAGIELELVLVDHATFHAQIRQDRSQLVYYGAARFPIAQTYLTQFFDSASTVGKPTAVTNFSHCSAGDAELRRARLEQSEAARLALWATAQRKIVDDVCAIPLFELGQPWAWSNTLRFGADLEGSLGLSPPIDETTRLAP